MNTRAFTIVELLVVVGVVAVLLAIATPALLGSKTAAESAGCVHTLRQLGVAYGVYTSDYDTMMPTMFARGDGAPCRIGNWGGNGYDIKPGDQVWFWAYPLRTYLGDATDWSSSSALSRAVSTPRVYDEGRYSFTCDGLTYELTAEFAGASYAHCPTLFTSASAWTGERVPDLSGVSEPVSAALIRSPSDKTNLVTVRTFYAENAPLASALPNDRANWLACDGHAETIGVGDLRRGIPFGCSCFENRTALGVAYPGLGTPGGVYGRDR